MRAYVHGDAELKQALMLRGRKLVADTAVQGKVQQWFLSSVRIVVLRYRHEPSTLIADVVKSWNATEVGDKLERGVGGDQWNRRRRRSHARIVAVAG